MRFKIKFIFLRNVTRERSEPQMELSVLRHFSYNFKNNKYYFFTIKPNNNIALHDNVHDMVQLIRYIVEIVQSSSINKVVYIFELDSKKVLHVHGLAQSKQSLRYSKLHRTWGVHHHFEQIPNPKPQSLLFGTSAHDNNTADNSDLNRIQRYMLKSPIGCTIKTLKDKKNNITTLAYLDK